MSHQVALRYTRKYDVEKVRVLTLVKNRGKGGAVRMVRPKMSNYSMCECRKKKSNSMEIKFFFVIFACVVFFLSHLKGTMSSRGKVILMADADGATKFSDIEKVEAGLHDLNPKPVWRCSDVLFCLTYVY